MIRICPFFPPSQLLLVLLAFSATVHAGARPASGNEGPAGATSDREEMAGLLGAEVREISGSAMISRAKKEKRISTAVRVAVVSATTYQKNPADALGHAIELTEAAAQAAPAFAEVIANAASFTPALSRMDGASAKIRASAMAAAKNKGKPGRAGSTSLARNAPRRADPAAAPTSPAPHRPRQSIAANRAPDLNEETAPPIPAMVETAGGSHAGNDTQFKVDATVGIRRDDNIFLTADNTVSDTSFIVTPGLGFRYGLESLAHGSLDYRETFIRYAGKSAPNASLGAGAADFGYDNGSVSLAANGRFQQLSQNTNATAGLAPQIYRRDVLDLSLVLETPLTAKTRIRTGASLSQLDYKTVGLVGTRQTEIPLSLFLETTPKTSVGLGATYRTVKPQGAGPSGHDLYYNLVTRGAFTQKLSGEVSVGYRTREVGVNPRENLWGFDGSLNYAATEKSSLGLRLARDFSTGALGESLTTNSYLLQFHSDLTPQWSVGSTLSYQNSGFGPTVFKQNNVPVTVNRQDDYWEGALQSNYTFTNWLTASVDYTYRKNHSTRPDAFYGNNVFNLTMAVRY